LTNVAAAVKDAADAAARAEAAERLAINAELRHKFADMNDFWRESDLNSFRGEDGKLDMSLAHQHGDELLDAHSHWRAVPTHGAAAADFVSGSGQIGFGPRSVLDGDNVDASSAPRDWAGFLQDAARGE
jgi:hypothetical protein